MFGVFQLSCPLHITCTIPQHNNVYTLYIYVLHAFMKLKFPLEVNVKLGTAKIKLI